MDLENILKGEEPPEIKPEVVVEAVAEEPVVEEITPEPEPTDVKEEGSTSEPEKMLPYASYAAEKEKRQKYEEQVAELTRKLEEAAPKPDIYEDPEGYVKAQTNALETKLVDMKVNMSVELARTSLKDYDEIVGAQFETWNELAAENPALVTQANNSDNPGLFAYQTCKNHLTLKEIGDPASFKERVKAEILKELEASNTETAKKDALKNLPRSLASVPAGTNKEPAFQGPTPLTKILG